MRGLENKRVLITGGVSGIGRATAIRFLEEGSRVVVLDRDKAASERLRQEQPSLSGIIIADVSEVEDVTRAFTQLDELIQGLDVLINNAGISMRHTFSEITPEEWQRVIDVNLNGVFYVAQQAVRRMLEAVNKRIPLGRPAQPDEVAALFAFLASSDAAYITGHHFVIDGGEIVGGLLSR